MPSRRGRGVYVLSFLALAVVIVVAGYALYLANLAGRLPWQEEPTRIPITPFANLQAPVEAEAPPATPAPDASSRRSGAVALIVLESDGMSLAVPGQV